MSIENLMFMHKMNMQFNGPLNIDCGTLRRIGKTSCIRQMIAINQYRFSVVIVPAKQFVSAYHDLDVQVFVLPDRASVQSRQRHIFEFSMIFRGSDRGYYVYADEVPDAEAIVKSFPEAKRVYFVAGFYSIYSPRVVETETYLHQPKILATSKMEFIVNEN